MVAGFNANVNGNFTNKFLVASHKTVPDVQLERFHGPLELEVLLLDVLKQLIVDPVVVLGLRPYSHDDEGDEAEENGGVPHDPHPLIDHLSDVQRLQDVLSGVPLLHQADLDHQSLEVEVDGSSLPQGGRQTRG